MMEACRKRFVSGISTGRWERSLARFFPPRLPSRPFPVPSLSRMVDNDSQTDAEEERHHREEQRDDDNDNNSSRSNNLLFSCQCDSARKVATLLSCLRRVVTVGGSGGGSSNPSSATGYYSSASHHGGMAGNNMTQSFAAAKAIAGGSSYKIQHVTVYAGPDGLTFHVQHGLAKQAQCSVDMPKTMFRDYYVGEEEVWVEDESDDEHEHDDETSQQQQRGKEGTKEIIQGGEFSVNLTTLLDCFSILSKTGNKQSSGTGGGSGVSGSNGKNNTTGSGCGGEYASLSNVPLCMSYDRGTATLHLELLESGSGGGGGCLVTCEVPGVAVADDVDDGPENDDEVNRDCSGTTVCSTHSGLATAFRSSPILTRAILCSDALQSAVSELYDVPGAKIVAVSLTAKGLEFGTIGPRSEVWVNVPYHRGQEGLYVGLESYNRIADDNNIVRRYSLGAFLSGMRGLDVGVETCISVNARGIMAIQHQVSRYEYLESRSTARPSFVDFIMTCIEDDDDDDNAAACQAGVNDGQYRIMKAKSGLQDITNTESLDEEISIGRKTQLSDLRSRANNGQRGVTRSSTTERSKSSSSPEDKQRFSDGESTSPERAQSSMTSLLLDELEVDKDLISSHKKRATPSQGRNDALEDIRRRRQERQLQQRRCLDDRNRDEARTNCNQADENDSGNDSDVANNRKTSNDSRGERKRHADNDAGSRKNRRSGCAVNHNDDAYNRETSNREHVDFSGHHSNLAQDTQTQSEDDDREETDGEDDLDVTAEIPQLFSNRNSISTTKSKNDAEDNSESEIEQEPRMMYGDTKLEFTQDSDDSANPTQTN